MKKKLEKLSSEEREKMLNKETHQRLNLFSRVLKFFLEKNLGVGKKFKSYNDLSSQSGVSQGAISNYINGKLQSIRISNLEKLSIACEQYEPTLSEIYVLLTTGANISKYFEIDDKGIEKLCEKIEVAFKGFGIDFLEGVPENIKGFRETTEEKPVAGSDPKTDLHPIEEMKPYRFKDDHYKQLPVLKATGGPLIQFLDDHSLGHADKYEWAYTKEDFAFFVDVEGDSMEPKIDDGDYCLISDSKQVKNGDIVLAVHLDKGATVKKLEKKESGWYLKPLNTKYEPEFIPNDELDGWRIYKVVESRKRFNK